MTRRARFWLRFAETAGLLLVLSCGPPRQARVGETVEMGPFRVRVESVEVEDRRHQGVELEMRVRLSVDGGNRFERMDFADRMNRARAYLEAADGWRQKVWVLTSGEDARSIALAGYPGKDRRGYRLSLGNPYGKPSRVEVELGR